MHQVLKGSGLYIFVVWLLLAACDSGKDAFSSRPVRSMWHPEPEWPEVQKTIFHLNDSVSRVYFKIANDRLLYKRPDTSKVFYAQARISCQLLLADHPRIVADSVSVWLQDHCENELVPFGYLTTYIDVKARAQTNYDLDVLLYDLNRRTKYKMSLVVIKEDRTWKASRGWRQR